jgi:hypothetical protein
MKIPSSVREPCTKMIGGKPFHLCIHHMAWTSHHPDHCRICPIEPPKLCRLPAQPT